MAKREKTSEARYFTMRLNPASGQVEIDTLAAIDRLIEKGFTFKAIAQDAILRTNGKTPEMYTRELNGISLNAIQGLFEDFAKDLLREVRKGGFRVQSSTPDDNEFDGGDVSPFAASFAKSFIERQRQARGDE
jgi:hypothetical protein